jgi:hypothetical protein
MDPRRLLPVLTAVACALVVATLVVGHGRPEGVGRADVRLPAAPAAASQRPVPDPAGVLAGWDERRADAWARADAGALADLYAPGSRSGAADVRLLRAYARRGLRVEGLTTQVLALRVVEARDQDSAAASTSRTSSSSKS